MVYFWPLAGISRQGGSFVCNMFKGDPTFTGFIERYGRDAARAVSDYFGGHRVYIPKHSRLDVIERNAFLRMLYQQTPGFTYADLQAVVESARGERLSIRQIRRTVHKK